MVSDARPRFTIVSAVYNVAPYLPDFIDSLETQSRGLEGVEILMVDDGSTDDSPQILAAWAERRPGTVRVVTQPNAGQGAARNTGIREARGEWITFPDPDDVLAPRYLAVVDTFLEAHPDAHLVATHRMIWHEESGTVEDTHPLRSMFHADPYVDLTLNPERFHGSSPASFFRLDRIRELGLEFDGRVRPNFEDGHFNCRYLLAHPRPRVGFLDSRPVPLPQARRRELHAPDVPGPSRSLRGGDGARLPRRGAACPRAVRRRCPTGWPASCSTSWGGTSP